MNVRTTTQRNIKNYYSLIIPIIIVSKIVRWTIMYPQLVAMSIGWGYLPKIQSWSFSGFRMANFSETTNAGSIVDGNTISFFQLLNLGFTSYQSWEVYITILYNILILICVKNFYERNPYAGKRENWFIYMNVAILNIFCLNLAKEPYQMLFFFLMALAISVPKTYREKSIALIIALLITILYSRKYYGLVLMYFLILNYIVGKLFGEKQNNGVLVSKKKLYGKLFFLFLLFGVLHYFFMSSLMIENEGTYNEMMAANSRDSTDAVSEITPIFPNSNPFLLAVDYFIKIFRLMMPVELLLKLKVTYLFMIVNQWLILTFWVRAFINRDKKCNPTRTIAMYLYIAFLLCSAAFEPDFGSWTRHQGVAFPVILLLI
ncbi:MAG: hypothetical protein J1F40_06555 [Prevotellaceae bacterium]|nr:hypothetical protein [Prevotellaceae bacterium]